MDTRGDDGRHPGRVGLRLPRHLRGQPALSGPQDELAEVVDRVDTARGELVLRRRGDGFEVISNGVFLMDTRDGRSERLLVRAALDAVPGARSALIGGLGVGFSLVEAVADPWLDRIDVVEIEDTLVGWHDRHLRHLTGDALDDPRVRVVVDNLVHWLDTGQPPYDVLCVDVDNGPTWTVTPGNAALYDRHGTEQLRTRGRVEHAFIGITAKPVSGEIARLFRLPANHGLLVMNVEPGSGSAAAGLRAGTETAVVSGESWPVGGDLIVSADGVPLSSLDQLRELIASKDPGEAVSLDVYRGNEKLTIHVKLGRQPSSPR